MAESEKMLFVVLVLVFSFAGILTVSGNEYEVGDEEGWKVPSDDQFYNKWASRNRFLVGDTIIFKYKKDSVMVVTEEEYGNCSSSHPVLFDNKGRTEVGLDRAGSFFFVSGISGHCKMGQKMIVKVLGGEGSAPPAANRTAAGPPAAAEGSAAAPGGAVSSFLFLLALFVGLFSCSSSRF